MTVKLTQNFLANARGLTFKDGSGVTWAINQNTNEITATAGGSSGGLGSLTVTATDPNIYGPVAGGKQLVYSLATLDSSSAGTTFTSNYFGTQDNGAQNTNPYGRTVQIDMLFGGASLVGSRAGLLVNTVQQSATGNMPSGNANGTYGTINAICTGSTNDNGTGVTGGTAQGTVSTANFIVKLLPGATNWYSTVGLEIDSNMQYGSSAFNTRGLAIVKLTTTAAQGANEDSAITIGSQNINTLRTATGVACTGTAGQFSCTGANLVVGMSFTVSGANTGSGSITGYVSPTQYLVSVTDGVSTFTLTDTSGNPIVTTAGTLTGLNFTSDWGSWGWKVGLALCGPNPAVWPFATTSTLISSVKGGICATGIDFSLVTFKNLALNFPGFTLDGSGNANARSITTTNGGTIGGGAVNINIGGTAASTLINTGPSASSGATIGGVGNNTSIGGSLVLSQAGGISKATWGVNGIVFKGVAQTLTDTSASGTIANEVAASLPSYTFATPTNAITITDLSTFFVDVPIAGTNVTATNLWSIKTGGGINCGGLLNGVAGATIAGGTVSINVSSNNNTAINTGSSAGATTIGNAASTFAVNAPTTLFAGTATLTPLKLTSGTLNTTPAAGGLEFNLNNLYFSSVASRRATVLTAYEYVTSASTTLGTGTSSWLGTAGTPLTAGVTLQANTVYEFEGEFWLNTSGTTSHTEAIGFTLTTMTANYFAYSIEHFVATGTATAVTLLNSTAATPTVMTGALTTAQNTLYRVKGTVSVATGGSLLPVIKFSANPGGTSTSAVGAYFRIWPLGASGADVSIGTWS